MGRIALVRHQKEECAVDKKIFNDRGFQPRWSVNQGEQSAE